MAGASIYCASKFAVMGFSEALAQELQAYNIKFTAVAPGSFRTDFLDTSSARFGTVEMQEYSDFSNAIRAGAAANNHAQSGDPAKLDVAIVALALSADAPLRFLADSDALKSGTEHLRSALTEIERWKVLSTSTDN